tara:strand:- start:11802 stop:12038 length:237 start_codon:yes stop_codon:yes gene_type:complete
MPRFEVGDVVECTQGTYTRLTKGKTYVVVSYDDEYVRIVDNLSEEGGWAESRFTLFTPATPKLTGMTQFYKDREISYE